MEFRRGEIVLANLNPIVGSEQGGNRSVLIIQNDVSNVYSSTTIVVPITSKRELKTFVTNIPITAKESKIKEDSVILCNQIRTIDRRRIGKRLFKLDSEIMRRVDSAIKISLGLDSA